MTLVARTDFSKFNGFSLGICYLKSLILQKSLIVIKRKMFQLAIDENRMVVTPKMTLIETFLQGHYVQWSFWSCIPCLYICTVLYVGLKAIFSPVIRNHPYKICPKYSSLESKVILQFVEIIKSLKRYFMKIDMQYLF